MNFLVRLICKKECFLIFFIDANYFLLLHSIFYEVIFFKIDKFQLNDGEKNYFYFCFYSQISKNAVTIVRKYY